MHRLIVAAVLIFSAALPARSAGLVHTLGINYQWNIEETKAAFAKAGIRETAFGNDPELQRDVKHIAETWFAEVSPYLKSDSILFEMMDPDTLPKPQCLYYENAVEPREDIALVAVCFFGNGRQVLIMPFFREGKIDNTTLVRYLKEEYGDLQQTPGGEIGSGRQPKFIWVERPWFHGGMIPKKYIFDVDAAQWKPGLPSISAFIVYLDAWNYDKVREDIESDQEAAKAAADKAKKDLRKGL